MEYGTIIIGYPGIGKTSLVRKRELDSNKKNRIYVDLESSYFSQLGLTPEEWAQAYKDVAEDLVHQGFNVFTSCHYGVQQALVGSGDVIAVFPSQDLKNEWIAKLHNRAVDTNLAKDKRAKDRAAQFFDSDIATLKETCINYRIPFIELTDMNYNLSEELNKFFSQRSK